MTTVAAGVAGALVAQRGHGKAGQTAVTAGSTIAREIKRYRLNSSKNFCYGWNVHCAPNTKSNILAKVLYGKLLYCSDSQLVGTEGWLRVEEPCADEWFSLGVGSAWVKQTVNFNNGWHPVDESKYNDKTLKKREAADLVFARHQIQAGRRSTLVLPTQMRAEIEMQTEEDAAADEPETVAANVRLTVPVVLEWPIESITECTDEGYVELTATEVQQGEATTAAIVTLQAVRPTEVMVIEQPVQISAVALQEAVARAAARVACFARKRGQAATIVEAEAIASTVTTGMTEATADMAIGVFGVAGVDDMTRTAVDNMEIATRAGEATEMMAVVEVIAGAAGMTEAAAYTTAGVAVAAGAATTTKKKRFKKRRPQYSQKTPGHQREKEY